MYSFVGQASNQHQIQFQGSSVPIIPPNEQIVTGFNIPDSFGLLTPPSSNTDARRTLGVSIDCIYSRIHLISQQIEGDDDPRVTSPSNSPGSPTPDSSFAIPGSLFEPTTVCQASHLVSPSFFILTLVIVHFFKQSRNTHNLVKFSTQF
jgi:hypothetical protein